MTKYLVFFIPFFLLITCSTYDTEKEFEGVIEFKITYDNDWDDSLKGTFYTKEKYYYKKGNYRSELFKDMEEPYKIVIYNSKENMMYLIGDIKDTILYWSGKDTEKETEIIDYQKNKEKILNYPCNYVKVRIDIGEDSIFVREMEYWASESIIISSDRFKNLHDMGWDQNFSKLGSIPLKKVLIWQGFQIIYEAIKVTEKELDDSLFEIDKSKPMKKIEL